MATITMPIHPSTGLPALGVLPSGRVVWPVMGGDDSDEAAAKAAADAKAAEDAAKAAADATRNDKGFPDNTPLEQMTVEQREAYWKHQARKHEERVKAYNGMTPEAIAELKAKADKHDALEFELMSDKDKAVTEAKETAEQAAAAKYQPALARAEFRAALKGRVPDDQINDKLAAITDPLDLSKFLTASGDVDTDKVSKFVENITPATGTSTTRIGPSSGGQGALRGRTASSAGSGSVSAGRDLYAELHPKKAG